MTKRLKLTFDLLYKILISCMGGYGAEHLSDSIVNSSLGSNVEIHGTHIDPFLLARSSAKFNFLTPLASDTKHYIEKIAAYIEQEKIDLFIPKSDKEVTVCSQYRDLIHCAMFLPCQADILGAQDKFSFYEILNEAGIHVAKTEPVRTLDNLPEVFDKLGEADKYWVRVKTAGEAGAFGATWVENPSQASQWIQLWNELNKIPITEFTISEYLPGRLFEVLTLFSDGELKIAKIYENIEYYGGSGISGVGSTPKVAKTCSDSSAMQAVQESLKAIHALSQKTKNTPNGIYHFSVKESIDQFPCITECNIGRFPSTCGFFNKIGKFNVGEWFVRFALKDLISDSPYNSIDLEHDPIYMIRSLDHKMVLLPEDAVILYLQNQ